MVKSEGVGSGRAYNGEAALKVGGWVTGTI